MTQRFGFAEWLVILLVLVAVHLLFGCAARDPACSPAARLALDTACVEGAVRAYDEGGEIARDLALAACYAAIDEQEARCRR